MSEAPSKRPPPPRTPPSLLSVLWLLQEGGFTEEVGEIAMLSRAAARDVLPEQALTISKEGRTRLQHAAKVGDEARVRELLAVLATLTPQARSRVLDVATFYKTATALSFAVRRGDLPVARLLIEAGASCSAALNSSFRDGRCLDLDARRAALQLLCADGRGVSSDAALHAGISMRVPDVVATHLDSAMRAMGWVGPETSDDVCGEINQWISDCVANDIGYYAFSQPPDDDDRTAAQALMAHPFFSSAIHFDLAGRVNDPTWVDELCRGFPVGADVRTLSVALWSASGVGLLTRVKELLKRGARPLFEIERGDSTMVFAASRGHTDVARALLRSAAEDANPEPGDDGSRLLGAVHAGLVDEVALALDDGAHPDFFDYDLYETPIAVASAKADLDAVRMLCDAGATWRDPVHGAYPALFHAVSREVDVENFGEVEDALVGAEVAAAEERRLAVVNFLLDRGADPAATIPPIHGDFEPRSVLTFACSRKNGGASIVRRLLQACHTADPIPPLQEERMQLGLPLLHACAARNIDIVRSLLDAGAAVNKRGQSPIWPNHETTPLVVAAGFGDVPCVAALLASPNIIVDAPGEGSATALAVAARNGHGPVVRLLLEAGADPLAVDSSGRSAERGASGSAIAVLRGRAELALQPPAERGPGPAGAGAGAGAKGRAL